jgi:hypothetical protein
VDAVQATRETLGLVHEYVEAAFGDVEGETLSRVLPGATIGSIESIYLHTVAQEDWAIQELILGRPKLIEGAWAARLGIAAPKAGEQADFTSWNHDVGAFKEYAQAVFNATDDYLNSITDADLDKQIDWFGRGTRSAAWVIADTIHVHASFHAGEISALKGVMGLKGLPW